MKETERLSAVNSIQSKCLKFTSTCLNSSAHWVNRELRSFLVSYKMFFGVLTVVIYKIYFSQHYDFHYSIYKSMTNTNSKQHALLMDLDKEKPLIQIL